MSTTLTLQTLQNAMRISDVQSICTILDNLGNDVLSANYTEGVEYSHDIYAAAEKVYVVALKLVFGNEADEFRNFAELGANDHAGFIVYWFADKAYRAQDAAEEIAAFNADHADGWHSVDRDPRNYAENFAYWVAGGCKACAEIALDNACREVAEIIDLLDNR